jgi:putative spermidine/putrescine transport system permease protein
MRRDILGRTMVATSGIAVLVFLCTPILIVIPMSFAAGSGLQFPPQGLSLQWYRSFFSDAAWLEAVLTSLNLAFLSSLIALGLGTLAAYGLARSRRRFVAAMEINFMAPMIVPHIITALALYFTFAWLGILGTFAGLVIGHAVVILPFVVSIVGVAIRGLDFRIEQSAASLGAGPVTIFTRIVLPNISRSVLVAWIFCFITSFDEVVIAYFVAGTYVTVPKKMFTSLSQHIDPTIAAVATLLVVSSSLLAVLAAGASRENVFALGKSSR